MHDLSRLTDHLQSLGRVLLGYSGGVDSALLAVAATDLAIAVFQLALLRSRWRSEPSEEARA